MRLQRSLGLILLIGCLSGAVAAQDEVAAGLAQAQAKIEAKEWPAALEVLLGLVDKAASDEEREAIAAKLGDVGDALSDASAFEAGLRAYQEALAMHRRLRGERDDPDVATSLSNVADCLQSLGRSAQALPQFEAALAMHRRLHGERDHPEVAASLNNLAVCLNALGKSAQAFSQYETALAMVRRLHGGRDHPDVAASLSNMASCLHSLGKSAQALPQYETVLAMHRRLHAERDHPTVAVSLNNVAFCLHSLGQSTQALPQYEAALAMHRRLRGERDHPSVALSLNNVAGCLESLGQRAQALPQFEAALAMYRRLYGDREHPDVATSLDNVAGCLSSLGQSAQALPQFEAALAMRRRLHGEPDHPDVALSLNNLASCLGQSSQALSQHEAALAMRRRLYGERDHQAVAQSLNNLALCLQSLGQSAQALPQYEAALAMRRRLYGERDHPDVALSLNRVTACLRSLDQLDQALPHCELACAMIERLREHSRTSAELQRSFFDDLKRGGAFEQLQTLAAASRPANALHAAERSRGRELLDMLEQQRFDPLEETQRRAKLRGDTAAAERLQSLRTDLAAANLESDRLLHQLTQLDDQKLEEPERAARRKELLTDSERASVRQRQLLDERARRVGDGLPVGRVRTPEEIQAALGEGELLLMFTFSKHTSLLYVVARGGEVQALPLPKAVATAERVLPMLLPAVSRSVFAGRGETLGGDSRPTVDAVALSRELFQSLIPKDLWLRLLPARRVFLAAHRALHRLPFELLVTDVEDGKPVYWLDRGPEIAYVPSGSALCWLRQRAREAGDDATSLELMAIGDPRRLDTEPEVPEQGVLVLTVNEGGEGARVGLLPRDVLVRYDGKPLADDTTLRDLRTQIEAAVEDGKREKKPIAIEIWRRGKTVQVDVSPGLLGVQVGKGRARLAHEASLGTDQQLARITRAGDLDRISHLPGLRGARAETETIAAMFAAQGRKTETLLDVDATEPAVFELAAKAKFLHFACHGIAEEYAGQSLSMLVLSQPQRVLPEDDGLLKLGDLLHRWRGRLASCRLVVLSACRTQVGPTLRDEAPQALPLGFLFAGVPAVVSTLWAVDDASTRELMTDFYKRLLAGERDRLKAFTAAKRELRKKFPEPYYWAPFLYIGSPE